MFVPFIHPSNRIRFLPLHTRIRTCRFLSLNQPPIFFLPSFFASLYLLFLSPLLPRFDLSMLIHNSILMNYARRQSKTSRKSQGRGSTGCGFRFRFGRLGVWRFDSSLPLFIPVDWILMRHPILITLIIRYSSPCLPHRTPFPLILIKPTKNAY